MPETAIQELTISEENIFSPANLSVKRNWRGVIQDYTELTKPRIIVLLLITTAGAMWIASEGQVDGFLIFITVLGGAIAAASANAINCLYDRDIDAKMERTSWRPIPSGRTQPLNALIFAITLAVISFTLLAVYANLLAACLAMSGIATYVGIYTIWLKRSSTQNIVIGGAAGAIPPLVGWAAVTGELSWAAWVLFAIIFVWTPPHFWALALMIRDEYAKVGVPMLPVVKGDEVTLAFIYKAKQLLKEPSDRTVARSVFKYSILYLALLCVAMGIDSLPFAHISSQQAIALLQATNQILSSI